MKKVLIKIKGTQGADDEQAVIELATEGVMRQFEDEYILSYSDDQTVEGSNTKTQLTVKGDKTVILERRGDLNSRLVITEGERNQCLYAIPQGSLTLGIYGKEVKCNLNESGGRLKMAYAIDANLEPLSENTVEITVEER
ncbi:MAG: DUF1934 domain-containing protein [Clostridia bacterium]|nr:DUF1934 domain-containing protein [Clostridia bacterium]